MRKILLFIVSAIIISSCGSVNKQMQRGNYDAVIDKTVKSLVKKPDKADDIKALDRAYSLANERDLERIKYLKIENNPNNWDEVFRRYDYLKARQARVRTVLPLNLQGRTINYEYVDYDYQIVEAKRNAAEYFYNNGKKLIQNPDRISSREAYYQLIKAQQYSGDSYPGLTEMIIDAKIRGTSKALVQVYNSSALKITPEFEEELLTFNTQGLNSEWVEFHFRHINDEMEYDYLLNINITDILLSPEQTKETDVVYKKDVQDGFNYALDSKGNVMRDTAGNDIRIPKYKTLSASVIETQQQKDVTIRGVVEIMELKPTRKLIVKEPITANNAFRHVSARAIGDAEALDEEAKKKVESSYIPYPNDFQMIFNCTETLKPAIRNAIYLNRKFIQ
jgi:hypothetical protein